MRRMARLSAGMAMRVAGVASAGARSGLHQDHDGSCTIVVTTDAPLDARDLNDRAAGAVYGLVRTRSSFRNGSGDLALPFTAKELRVKFGVYTPQP